MTAGWAGGLLRSGRGRPIATTTPRTDAHGGPSKIRNGRAVVVGDREPPSFVFYRNGHSVGRRGSGIALRRRPRSPRRRGERVGGWPSTLAKGPQRRVGRRAGRGAARSSFRWKEGGDAMVGHGIFCCFRKRLHIVKYVIFFLNILKTFIFTCDFYGNRYVTDS